MTDEAQPEAPSLERAQQAAKEALEGPTPGSSPDADGHPSSLLPLPPGSPARVSRTFAWFLDDLVGVPGTTLRFGVDPILSFIPIAGTAVAAVMGSVILVDSVRLRAPIPVLARMVGNYVIDWGLGLVPFVGALFDALYRSNHKNFKLLERTIVNREQVRKASIWYWASIFLLTVVVVGTVLAVPMALLLWLDSALTGR